MPPAQRKRIQHVCTAKGRCGGVKRDSWMCVCSHLVSFDLPLSDSALTVGLLSLPVFPLLPVFLLSLFLSSPGCPLLLLFPNFSFSSPLFFSALLLFLPTSVHLFPFSPLLLPFPPPLPLLSCPHHLLTIICDTLT